jgi:16S rRNA (cytosine967-C5)-methyltransferase
MVTKHTQTQAALLNEAAAFVKPGGRLVYVTCSILPPENEERVAAFLEGHGDFELMDWREMAAALTTPPPPALEGPFLQLAPHLAGTDGFFVAILSRKP